MNWISSLADFIFPHTCVVCGALGLDLCQRCSFGIVCYQESKCPYCRQITVNGKTHESCRVNGGLDGLWIIFPYVVQVKKIVHEAKYRNIRGSLKELIYARGQSSLLHIAKKIVGTDCVLVPIPLSDKRFKTRGYNQATYIANVFADFLNTNVDEDTLKRVVDTVPQSQLSSSKHKATNVSGAFSCTLGVADKKFVLVDDVWTTGATVKEACRVLKGNGAQEVYAIVLSGGTI